MSFLVSHSKIALKLSFHSFFIVLLTGLFSALPAGAQTVLYQHNFQGGAGLWNFLQPTATNAWSVSIESYFDPFSNQNIDNTYLSGKVAGATDSLLAYPKNSLAFSGNTLKIQWKAKRIGTPNVRLVIAAYDYDVHGFIEIRSKAHVLYTSPNLGTDWATFTTYLNKVGAFANSQNIVPVFWFETDGGQTIPEGALDDVLVETVTNTAPGNVVLSSPVAGTLYGNTFTCTATATDNNLDRMAFYDEEVLLGEVSQSPYSLSVNLSSGNHRIKARAIDAYGMYTETAKTTVTINSAPQFSGTEPPTNTQFNAGAGVLLKAFANDINNNLDKVEFYVNSQKVGEDNQAPYQFSYTNAAGGVFEWYARAIDQMGLWTSSHPTTFTIAAPPSVSIISPANLGELGSCNVHIQANTNAGAGTVSHLNFYRNDTLLASDSTAPYEYKGNGWAPGTYTVLTRGYTTTGLELLPASITFQVVEAELQAHLHEQSQECRYQLAGQLQANENIRLVFSNWNNGGAGPETFSADFSTGNEALDWVHQYFELYDPEAATWVHYRMMNQYGCVLDDSLLLHPEQGSPRLSSIEPLHGLKHNPNTGEYYYCRSDSANLAFTADGRGFNRLEVLDPNDPSLILDTLEGPEFHLSSSLAAYNGVGLRALSPLGCASEDVFSLVWGVAENPVVTVAPVTVYGSEPALAVAQASGGTGPYSFAWSSGVCLDSSRCDSVTVSDFSNQITVSIVDGNSCQVIVPVPTVPAPPPLVAIPSNLFRFSILTKDSLIIDTMLATDGKIGFMAKFGNGSIANPVDSIVDSIAIQTGLFSGIADLQSQLNSLPPNCTNCPLSTVVSPGVRNISGDYEISSVLELEGKWHDQFIWNITGDLILLPGAEIRYHNNSPAHVIWNVQGNIVIHTNSVLKGSVIANGKISIFSNNLSYTRLISSKSIEIRPADKKPIFLFSTNDPTTVINSIGFPPTDCFVQSPTNLVQNPSFECGGAEITIPGNGETAPLTFYDPCGKPIVRWESDILSNLMHYKDGEYEPRPANYKNCFTLPVMEMQGQFPIYKRGFGQPSRAFIGLNLYSNLSGISLDYFYQELAQAAVKGPYIGRFRIAVHPDAAIGLRHSRRVGMFVSRDLPKRKSKVRAIYTQGNNPPTYTYPTPNSSLGPIVSNKDFCNDGGYNSMVTDRNFVLPNGATECPYFTITPQVMATQDNQLGSSEWVTIENAFQLEGGERFVTLGAFADHITTHSSGPLFDEEQLVNGHTPGEQGWQVNQNKMKWHYLFDAVEIIPLPRAGADVTICAGTEITLGEFFDIPGIQVTSFLWNTGATTPTIQVAPTTTETYSMTIIYNGQSFTSQVTVTVLPTPNAGADLQLCRQGDPAGFALAGSPAGGTWSGQGVFNGRFFAESINPEISTLELTYTNSCGSAVAEVTLINCLPEIVPNCTNNNLLEVRTLGSPTISWNDLTNNTSNGGSSWNVPANFSGTIELEVVFAYPNYTAVIPLFVHRNLYYGPNSSELLAGTHFFYGNSNFEKNIMIGLQDRYFNMGNIFMKGFLTVTGTLRSNQNSTFEVYGESRITINSTGLVESIGCGNFWPGIKMDMYSSFYAFPGARLRQMRNGINFGGPESNPPGLGFTPGCALNVDHLQLEDNYRNFVFYLPATGHIRNTVATYTGNLRVKPEANCIDNGFDAAECGELGFSFISFLRGESYNNQTTPNNLKIEDNQISRYMSGIYCQNLMGGNSNIAFTMERCTLSSYNRAVNFLSNTTATLKGNTFRPAIVGANNRDQYKAAMDAVGADNIGAMYGDQVQYCGVYSGANFCNILAEGNEFYGLGSTDPSAWDYGIHVRGSGSTLNLTGNLFNGLRKGLNIFSGIHNVQNFRCNTFVPHTAISTNLPCFGIVVGLEPGNNNLTTARIAGPIGGNGDPNIPNPDPSGNVWPVDPASLAAYPISGGPAVINNWQSPQGWTSLRNDNTDPDANLEYWAYNNEFVWPNGNNSSSTFVSRREESGEQIMIYRTGIPNPPVDDPGTVVYRPQCSTDLPDVFPLRMAADPGINSITSVLNSEIGSGQKALLGDAVPNPASTQVKIPVFIPESSMLEYHLSVFDLNGKNVLLKLPLVQKGRSLVELSLGDLPAGVYGYRLTENGKALGTRKLVLIK